MERQSELRNKYQKRDEAPTQPELFKKKKREMTDAGNTRLKIIDI